MFGIFLLLEIYSFFTYYIVSYCLVSYLKVSGGEIWILLSSDRL